MFLGLHAGVLSASL